MITAIYARKSTDQSGVADEQKSVARQIQHAREYAERKGWTGADEHVYADDGISGAEFSTRPGFLRLMNSLKPRPSFQVLVMSEESRLGREAIETAYALKQLVQAGVRVFFYLEGRERTLDSPTDKIMLSLTAFADELEREKARQRTRDAMVRKAQSGHVCGGWCYGYRNIDVTGAEGKRSHVSREIEPTEADVIRRIFQLCAEGYGIKAIAKRLNAEGAPSPRAQQGRSQTWAPTSVREVLYRPAYRGELVWGQTAKRDKWGRQHQSNRPEGEWIRREAPELRIVTEDEWAAAHVRLSAARAIYLAPNKGQPFGRPPLGSPAKYLLTGLSQCGECGNGLIVKSRSHGQRRAFFYGCGGYHNRGRTVCSNYTEIPMEDGNGIVVEALLDEVLDPSMLEDSANEAVRLLQGEGAEDRTATVERELATVEQECSRLVAAITAGGQLDGLVRALQARESRRRELEAQREQMRSERRLRASDAARVRDELLTLASSWRRVLSEDPPNARPIVSSLLKGRVAFTPTSETDWWEARGKGSFEQLFTRVFPRGVASPTGVVPEWSRQIPGDIPAVGRTGHAA
jgi:DNA invertase Pin-like site-specific DNA recombinase